LCRCKDPGYGVGNTEFISVIVRSLTHCEKRGQQQDSAELQTAEITMRMVCISAQL